MRLEITEIEGMAPNLNWPLQRLVPEGHELAHTILHIREKTCRRLQGDIERLEVQEARRELNLTTNLEINMTQV